LDVALMTDMNMLPFIATHGCGGCNEDAFPNRDGANDRRQGMDARVRSDYGRLDLWHEGRPDIRGHPTRKKDTKA